MNEMKKELFVIMLFILIGLGLIINIPLVFFTGLLSLLILYTAQKWNEYIFKRLKVRRDLNCKQIQIGEKITYKLIIENTKILPVLGLKIEDRVTDGIQFINYRFLKEVPGTNYNLFHDIFNLRWYERVKRNYQIKANKRGFYQLGYGTLYYKGLFGFFKNKIKDTDYEELIVYPKILPVRELGVSMEQLFGSRPRKGWLFPDPLNRVGIRPYQTTDNIKQINWKASARHGRLESNIYQPSQEKELHIFLQGVTANKWWEGFDKNRIEVMIIYAASLLNHGLDRGLGVGLYSNGLVKKSRESLSILPSREKDQKQRLLKSLALLQPVSRVSLAKIMEKKKKHIKSGSTVIVICDQVDDLLNYQLKLYSNYCTLHLICFKDKKLTSKFADKVHQIEGGQEWDEVKKLELV